MKKLFYSFAMLALLVGCSDDATDDGGKKEPEPEPTPTEQVITATFEESEIDLAWAEGDAISVFHSLANEKWAYNEEAAGFKKADNTAPTKKLNYVFGIYPYNDDINAVSNSNEITLNFPAKQAYVAGGFDAVKAPMLAVAEKDATALEFKPAYALVSVKVFGTAVIKEIALESANGEKLAGIATATMEVGAAPVLSFGNTAAEAVSMALGEGIELATTEDGATTFTFAVAPNTFSKGFFVKAVDVNDNVYRKAFNAEVVADRNTSVTLEGSFEIIAKTVTKTILDIQFNTDGTATDAGIYELAVEKVGDISPYVYVYDHPEFDANNIARFGHIAHNESSKKHSYYKVDYQNAEEFKAAMADGFTLEFVTYSPSWSYDWWSCPVGSDAFRIYRKGDLDGNEMLFNINSSGAWWPTNGGATAYTANTVFQKNIYMHTVFTYDSNNQSISIFNNGELSRTANEITSFNVGRWLTIGGYVENGEANDLFMQWNGEVALVKMYDQPLTEEEVVEKYTALNLPATSAQPAAATLSTPLFDIKFKEDKTAENVGSMASLVPTYYPNENTSTINVDGFGYVANFNLHISNDTYPDGFYRIDYTENEEFKSKLADGFTLEVVCLSNFDQGQFWMRPVSSNKWGFMLRDGGHKRWATYANHGDNSWGACGNLQQGGYHVYWDNGNAYWPAVTKHESFTHIVYIYNAEAKEFGTYVDGNFNGGKPEANFEVGSVLNVNGIPYINDVQMAHGWNGKVALVRVYDEAMTQDQVLERYEAIQPTIQTLNTIIE